MGWPFQQWDRAHLRLDARHRKQVTSTASVTAGWPHSGYGMFPTSAKERDAHVQ